MVYKFRKIAGKTDLSEQFKKIGYKIDILRQAACMAVNQIMADNFASLFNLLDPGSVLRLNDCSVCFR